MGRVNELLELEPKLKIWENIEYEIETIKDSIVYATKVTDQLLS